MDQIHFHPLADLFPAMEGSDFERLRADIEQNGQREPIWLYDGKIIDGRHRYRACEDLGREAITRTYEGDDPTGFVLSLNLHRRHLTESQRAMVASKLATLPLGSNQHDEGLPIGRASKMLNVGERTVARAKDVRDHAIPEITRAVESGGVAVSAAAVVAKLPEPEQRAIAAAGPEAIKQKAKEIRQAKAAHASEPASDSDPNPNNVVALTPRLPSLPAFDDLDRDNEARQLADQITDGPGVDLQTVDGRAHAINGALSTLDLIQITGTEYWSVFSKDPAKAVYEGWVRNAHAKLSDILKEIDNVQLQGTAERKARRRAKGTEV